MTNHENVPVPAIDIGQWTPSPGWCEETFKREWHDSRLAALERIEQVAQNPLGFGYRSFSIGLSGADMDNLRSGKTLMISGLDYHVTVGVEHGDS